MFDHFVVLFYPCFIFKEVSLVIRRVLIVRALTSQRSLSRKLLKEASRGSLLMKFLKEAVRSCLGKSTLLLSLTVGSFRNLVWRFIGQISTT